MKTYKIPCVWQMYGTMSIEAKDLDEAIEKARNKEGLPEGDFLTDSFEIDAEIITEQYPKEAEESVNLLS